MTLAISTRHASGTHLVSASWLGKFTFVQANAQTAAFNYQGRLSDSASVPATISTYQMQFALFDAPSGGTQPGATLTFDGAGSNLCGGDSRQRSVYDAA